MSQHSSSYWKNFHTAFATLWQGLKITFGHILRSRKSVRTFDVSNSEYFQGQEGISTLQYPKQSMPVPDVARYRLHNEIDDCIVCDKCAKVCPVDCIEIEPIRAVETFGTTSDGTPKRIHAARFDIDMGKCCFCGLCTTVCPTECLTMTKTFDFSEYDIRDHVYAFGTMSPDEIEEKQKALEAHLANKTTSSPKPQDDTKGTKPNKPVFRPRIIPPKKKDQ